LCFENNLRPAPGREQRRFGHAIRDATFMFELNSDNAIALDAEITEERKRSDRDV